MDSQLPSEVTEFGRSARDLLSRRAGVDMARRAHSGEDVRPLVRAILDEIEFTAMNPRAGLVDALAAAELCAAAGAVVLPYPIVPELAGGPSTPFAVADTAEDVAAVDHASMIDIIAGIDGSTRSVTVRRPIGGMLAPFVSLVEGTPTSEPLSVTSVALWLDLQASYIAGALGTAVQLTIQHVTERRQFGQPLSAFQALRFALVEASLAHQGLQQLQRYTIWRLYAVPEDAIVDALSLRTAAHEAARSVIRVAHQLHGAMGFADEHDLSFLTRGIQPYVRLPFDYEATCARLVDQIDASGFETLFGRFQSQGEDRSEIGQVALSS